MIGNLSGTTVLSRRKPGARLRRARLVQAALLASSALVAMPVAAQSWKGTTSTDFNDPSNWSAGAKPTNADTAVIDTSAPHTATIDHVQDEVKDLIVGENGSGTLIVQNGGVIGTRDKTLLGDLAGSFGEFVVSGSGSTYTNLGDMATGQPETIVGNEGAGTLGIFNGATYTDDVIYVGDGTGSDGSVIVSGTGSTLALKGQLTVGGEGTGSLQVGSGAQVKDANGELFVGADDGGDGSVIISGAGSSLVSQYAILANGGKGQVTVNSGGVLNVNDYLYLGQSAIKDGAHDALLTIDGAGSKVNAASLVMGMGTDGTMTITNSGFLNLTGNFTVGHHGGSMGTVTADGVGSGFFVGSLTVGDEIPGITDGGNTGIVNLQNGAGALVTGQVDIGTVGNTGQIKVDGAGSVLLVNGQLNIGNGGMGGMAVLAGGSVKAAGETFIGNSSTGGGSVNIDGGAFIGGGDMVVGNQGIGLLEVDNAGTLQVAGMTLGLNKNANGIAITANGANVDVTGNMTIGQRGDSQFTVMDGAVLSVDGNQSPGNGTITLGNGAGSNGDLIIGTLTGAPVDPGIVNASRIEFGDGSGGITFNHTSQLYTFASTLNGGNATSAVHVFGGVTNLTANSSGFNGATLIQGTEADATLIVTGTLGGSVIVGNDFNPYQSVLRGAGTLTGAVDVQDKGTLAGYVTETLTMGSLVLEPGAIVRVQLGDTTTPALFKVTGDLTLDGSLDIYNTLAFGAGVYRLFDYGGALTDNGLDIGTVANGANTGDLSVQTSVKGQVNLIYAPNGGGNPPGGGGNPPGGGGNPPGGGTYMFWDGDAAGNAGNGQVDGGNGTWTATSTNFTDAAGTAVGTYDPTLVIFEGKGGQVFTDNSKGDIKFDALNFAVDGYVLGGDGLTLDKAVSVNVGDGTAAGSGYTAQIDNHLTGSGGLIKNGSGTLILYRDNDYTGGTTIEAGTLQLGNGDTKGDVIGDVLDNGTLAFDRAEDTNVNTVFDGTISGTGDLRKLAADGITLSAAETFTGTTYIEKGTLALSGNGSLASSKRVDIADGATFDIAPLGQGTSIMNLSGAGTVNLGANTLTVADADAVYGGTIQGSGGFHLAGGLLQLLGTNTYSGGTSIDPGAALLIGNGGTTGSMVGSVADNGKLEFSRSDGVTFDGSVSGTGALYQDGPGMLTLTAANSYSGGTAVKGGTLRGTTTSLQGLIEDDSHLIFDQNSAGTFAGGIGGTGDLTKNGSGVVALTNTQVYSGATTLNAGGLIVLGGLPNSDVTVNGGLLGGYGPLKSLNMVGGTLSPGQSPGTMIVLGNASLGANSTYAVDLAANGVSDLLLAGGKVAIGDGTLALNGPAQLGYLYQIIGANGGVTGTFGTVTGGTSKPFLQTVVTYKPTAVYVSLALNGPALIGAALTPNERAAAHAVVDLPLTSPVAAAVGNLDVASAPAAFDQLSGEIHSDLRAAIVEDGRATGDRLIDRAGLGRKGLWGEATIGNRRITGDGNAATTRGNVRSVTVGVDGGSDRVGIGVTVGYNSSDIDVPGRTSSARMEALRMGAYGDVNLGAGFDLRGASMFARWTGNVSRTATIPGFSDRLTSKDRVDMLQSLAQLSWKGRFAKATLEPFGALDWVHLNASDIGEVGGPAALSGTAHTQNAWFGRLGMRLSTDWRSGSLTISPRLAAAWERAFGDRVSLVDTAFISSTTGTGYAVAGPIEARDRANLEAGIEVSGNRLSFGAGIGGSYAGRLSQTSARLHLRWQF